MSKRFIKPYDIPYQHQTSNHLFFDRVRAVQFEVELLKTYLEAEEHGRDGGAGLAHEIKTLSDVSALLFDEVYLSIRKKWL